ncbi:hypothetical protein [uncultured Paraglaciecola sp.]|uniref:hypothetical protein n=1 Tax=uncultured Paraglaciecola sp. TaxID=1765024 RepID=UPI002597960E|nr:hypothetical protein [uncultured Paraglaciecola sp.]
MLSCKNGIEVKPMIGMKYLKIATLSFMFSLLPTLVLAQESLCASVRIEIVQELAFERQGFDANMRITNSLEGISVENVKIDVLLMDESNEPVLASSDPDNTEALFFIRLDSLSGIEDVTGGGVIAPQSVADIHWLIVPAADSGGSSPNGTLYYVGATLSYTMGDEEIEIDVSPDYIFVKPMPLLTLDYFLPRDVYADDAFTAIIEPAIPFDLGVRITNNGFGTAGDVSIDSAQPKIIDNELGLLINFVITGSSLNDQAVEPTLLIPFGDLDANEVTSGRWQMETTLSGEFVEFSAEYSHVDELGGALTSLLESVNTHELVHNVLVDLTGRDGVRDFLAKDGDVLRVYESSGLDTEVTDQTSQSTLTLSSQSNDFVEYQLSAPETDGFLYAKFSDPFSGTKQVGSFLRNDGKAIPSENVWFSQHRKEDTSWEYFLHIFDVNSSGQYQLVLENKVSVPVAPVLQFITNKQVVPETQVSFIVEASDLNGTLPIVTVSPLPSGAAFFIDENGSAGISTYVFDWTPTNSQTGLYTLNFVASDGELQTNQTMTIRVCEINDYDCDGMDDDWEMEKFGTLDRDGTGDYDGDGYTDLQEYINGTDPLLQDPPSIPEILQPSIGRLVDSEQPILEVKNSTHGDYEVKYTFEVYSDENFTDLVDEVVVLEQNESASWTTITPLKDNSHYYWRVKACRETICSQWAMGSFTVNTSNQAPNAFLVSSPQNDTSVSTLTPTLTISNSDDPDGDAITYIFSIYEDLSLEKLVLQSPSINEDNSGTTSWVVNQNLTEDQKYFLNVEAFDSKNASTELEVPVSFTVNTSNSAPTIPNILAPTVGAEVDKYELELTIVNSTDIDSPNITYWFEIDTRNTFDSEEIKRSAEVVSSSENTTWYVDNLQENVYYYWRAKADDGMTQSDWVQSEFFVNKVNESPSVPSIRNPGDLAWVDTLRPILSVNSSSDPENDAISYRFEVYSDEDLSQLVTSAIVDSESWTVDVNLLDNTWYYWRTRSSDDKGNESNWTSTNALFVNDDNFNDAPSLQILQPSGDIFIETGDVRIAWSDADPDSEATISIFYEKETIGSGATLIVDSISEDSIQDEFIWPISGLVAGTYYVYLVIDDGETSKTVYSESKIFVGQTNIGSVVFSEVVNSTEMGACFEYDVTLGIAPRASVNINFELSNNNGSAQPNSLIFTPDNWSEGQQLIITGFDNCDLQHGVIATLNVTEVSSDDPAYNDINVDDLLLEINLKNQSPVADAGTDITGQVGTQITLDASNSTDPEDSVDNLIFNWELNNLPAGSVLNSSDINSANTIIATFTPDVAGEYQVKVTVSDGELESSDFVIIRVSEAATPNSNKSSKSSGSFGLSLLLFTFLLLLYRRKVVKVKCKFDE